MRVTTWTLESRTPPAAAARPLPAGARLERATGMTPEYARFLYGLVGGPWRWTDRLRWTRQQWLDDLAVPGTEFFVVYGAGVPWGYVHLQPLPADDGTHVELRYFGLAEAAIGRGIGGPLLEQAIAAAWSPAARPGAAPVTRVWVHTCTLDGPAALANYEARGLVVHMTVETDEHVPDHPLGAWASTGGPPS
jgi:GNAT superfamily N-acetyltransferase